MNKSIDKVCKQQNAAPPSLLKTILKLALEMGREGREGRKIGTIFTIGDLEKVLTYSRPLILDPLQGHPDHLKKITDDDVKETVKELAQLDGAFVVSKEGIVHSATRFLEAPTKGVQVPKGLGARHIAAAAISLYTDAIAVTVSASSIIRVFDKGKVIGKFYS
ncbi:MAG: hypothetical protein GWN62_30625 [Aliifodinibius sp.]|nr:hypothetical protein [Fodinibius sp.]